MPQIPAAPLGPLLFDTLGIDTVQFSRVVSAYTFAAGCAGFAAAAVLDRVGRRSSIFCDTVPGRPSRWNGSP
jgi:MFS family permease